MTGIPDFPCSRCGEQQEAVEITKFGDAEPRYTMGRACNCPGPRCFACGVRLREHGRCENLRCYMLNRIVPAPDIR
jgi:hypothetical protein